MPTYDYECNGCGESFEIFQQITERPKRKCPHCGTMKLQRLIGTGAAIIFRGSGFYETDYRSKEYKQKAKADNKTASESTSKDAGDGKAKSKAKSETKKKASDSGKSTD